jgi:hypothetical protein
VNVIGECIAAVNSAPNLRQASPLRHFGAAAVEILAEACGTRVAAPLQFVPLGVALPNVFAQQRSSFWR